MFLDVSDMHSNELFKGIKTVPVRSLQLSNNKMSDEGVLHILKAVAMSNVEVLSLANNRISEKCAESIVYTLKTSKNLK